MFGTMDLVSARAKSEAKRPKTRTEDLTAVVRKRGEMTTRPVHYRAGRFPPDDRIEWKRLVPSIGPTAAALARFDEALGSVPRRRALVTRLLAIREGVYSSRIEGIRATVTEVLQFEGDQLLVSSRRPLDIQEVLDCRTALLHAEEAMATLPLCQRVIKDAHRVLMRGLRGQRKAPGEYRKVPSWIGPPGCKPEDARFVPIEASALPSGMNTWEHYIYEDVPDRLAQLAVLHAEFEALHPFLDGNGRLGRMLVPLFLWQIGIIREPVFCISPWLEAHRSEYYHRLQAVSGEDDWTGWCLFFLDALRSQAEDDLARADAILRLYDVMKSRFVDVARSQHAISALDWVMGRPFFRSTDFLAQADAPKTSARRMMYRLRDGGIFQTVFAGSGRLPAVFAFPALLGIVDDEHAD